MTEEEYIAIRDRGQGAAKLIEDEALWSVIADLEGDTLTRWKATHSRDIDGREALYAQHQGIQMLRAELQSRLNAARIAFDRVEKQRQRDAEKAKTGRLRIVGGWREP